MVEVIFTTRTRRMGMVIVSLCLIVHTSGGWEYLPLPGPEGGTPRYLPCHPDLAGGRPQSTYPLSQVRMGRRVPNLARSRQESGYPKVPTPHPARSGWGGGYSKVGTLWAKVGTPGQGLATQRAVCLLRSRRRTF